MITVAGKVDLLGTEKQSYTERMDGKGVKGRQYSDLLRTQIHLPIFT